MYDFCCFFFVQAEDGIRDLVRSRGLGDVYKRQVLNHILSPFLMPDLNESRREYVPGNKMLAPSISPVSYTHLTLPTSDLV